MRTPCLLGLATVLSFAGPATADVPLRRPFLDGPPALSEDMRQVTLDPAIFAALKGGEAPQRLAFPLADGTEIVLELERFSVLAPDARIVAVGADGKPVAITPDVVTLRGRVAGQPTSHAFIALTGSGSGNGTVTLDDGRSFTLSQPALEAGRRAGVLTIQPASRAPGVPGFAEVCGSGPGHDLRAVNGAPLTAVVGPMPGPVLAGPSLVRVAVEADESYVGLFGGGLDSATSASEYIVQVIAAVSDIYERDLDLRLQLTFSRLWPLGGEPFGADDLGGFRDYYEDDEDPSLYDLIHMFSARRDTSYGGVAYVTGACGSSPYAISAFMLGAFPTPVDGSDLGNWDLVVVAHEMGHNLGSGHTHSAYSPPIDDCGSLGIHSRGTILSYCHTTAGGLLNIDMRMHGRVQEVIESEVAAGCLERDCDGNGVPDVDDIAGGAPDANGNGIPDGCEDCDGNGTLDEDDIAAGAPDVNGNGIPDGCEPDCNGNGIPDEHEINTDTVADANFNRIPDSCEADCDGSGTADFAEIAADPTLDIDRNVVLDSCQDCNGNGVADWIDLERPLNVFVADQGGFVREFHADSGVGVLSYAAVAGAPQGVVFGSDRRLYVSSFDDDRVLRIDVDTGAVTEFIASGVGGLDEPTALLFDTKGDLLVASRGTSEILRYDGDTGSPMGPYIAAGAGGLLQPYDVVHGPNGNLFVTSSDHTVLEYDESTGASVGTFVAAGLGGLSGPRGLAFTGDGRLLVASFDTGQLLEYSSFGAFIRPFTTGTVVPTGAWGVEIGPNGNVFVARSTGEIRILEYDVVSGLYVRSFIRADAELAAPTMFAFRSPSDLDCNGNGVLDACDLPLGGSGDCDGNGTLDPCEVAADPGVDADANGILDTCQALGDGNGDGAVDVVDLLAALGAWGPCPACPQDTNGDGAIDVTDLLAVLANWS